jgi:hypothetical protein
MIRPFRHSVGADLQERRDVLNVNIETNLAQTLQPFRDMYNTMQSLCSDSDRESALNGLNVSADELNRVFNHTSQNRKVNAALTSLKLVYCNILYILF